MFPFTNSRVAAAGVFVAIVSGHFADAQQGEIVFVCSRAGDRVAGTADEVELYVVGADGTDMRRITQNQLYDGQADR